MHKQIMKFQKFLRFRSNELLFYLKMPETPPRVHTRLIITSHNNLARIPSRS